MRYPTENMVEEQYRAENPVLPQIENHEKIHERQVIAKKIINDIIKDMNHRHGLNFNNIDIEIRQAWQAIVEKYYNYKMEYIPEASNGKQYDTLQTELQLARRISKSLSKSFRTDIAILSNRTIDGTTKTHLEYPTALDLIVVHKPTLSTMFFIDSESTPKHYANGTEKWPTGYKYPPRWNNGYSFLERKNAKNCIYIKHNADMTECYFITYEQLCLCIESGVAMQKYGTNNGRSDVFYNIPFKFLEDKKQVGFKALLGYINRKIKREYYND